jgi:hypothetical protein
MLKERELVKAKRTKYWQQEDYLWYSFIEIVKQLQCGENDKQSIITKLRNYCRISGLNCLIIPL